MKLPIRSLLGVLLILSGAAGLVYQNRQVLSIPHVNTPRPPISIVLPPEPIAPVVTKTPDFIAKLSKAVNALYSDRGNGIRFTCTTTNIQKTPTGYLALTAQHCIREAKELYIVIDKKSDAPFLRAQVVFDDRDYAFLTYNTAEDLPVIPLGTNRLLSLGDPLIVVSEPLDFGKILYHGYFSQEKVSDKFGFSDYIGLELNAAPGSSGSSVIDPKQEAIIGVLDAVAPSPFGGIVITLATPVSLVRQGLTDYQNGKRRVIVNEDFLSRFFGPAPRRPQ